MNQLLKGTADKAQILKSETFANISLYFDISIENQHDVGFCFDK